MIEWVGPDAVQHGVNVGDRVAAAILGGQNSLQPHLGAFAEHTGTRAQHLIKLPDTVSFETGSALGTSFMTAGLALFKSLDLSRLPARAELETAPCARLRRIDGNRYCRYPNFFGWQDSRRW